MTAIQFFGFVGAPLTVAALGWVAVFVFEWVARRDEARERRR